MFGGRLGKSKKRILVVDDDADWREYLKVALEDLGYVASEARDGKEALEELGHHDYSVVLLDLNMPGMRGEDVAEKISRPSQVVFLTSASAQDVGHALRQGPHYYLPKGASQQELSLLLQSLDA
jgi:two-component system chemotaxis response regulator CheY